MMPGARLLAALLLPLSWTCVSARPALFQPLGSAQGQVDIEVLDSDGTTLARWNDLDIRPGTPILIDSLPEHFSLRWSFGYSNPWESRPESLSALLKGSSGEGKLHVRLRTSNWGRCTATPVLLATWDTVGAHGVPDEDLRPAPSWKFTGFPLLSLRAGSPGLVGIQAGAGAGIGKTTGGGEGGSDMYLLISSLETDLRAASWRLGFSYLGFGNAAAGSFAVNAACRFAPWGGSGPLDCGPELDLMFLLFHARVGFLGTSGRATAGIGFGL